MFLSRLPTHDRLRSWGLDVPTSCVLCTGNSESHWHMFFECDFAVPIWSRFSGRYLINPPSSLAFVLDLLQHHNFSSSPPASIILKLLLQVVTYNIWRERNHRIFRDSASSDAAFFSSVDRAMRDRLLSLSRPIVRSPSLLELYFWFVVPYS